VRTTGVIAVLGLGWLLAGCEASSPVVTTPHPRECPVHHVVLVEETGYEPSRGTMADPSGDYIRFMTENEKRYPFARSWTFKSRASSEWSRKAIEAYCPVCEASFDRDFAAYRKQDEATKEARFWKAPARGQPGNKKVAEPVY